MEPLKLLSEILIGSYLLATLANLLLTQSVFREDFGQFQNWLGQVLLFGLVLNYIVVFTQRFLVDTTDFFALKSWDNNWSYNVMRLYPLFVIGINITRRLRAKKIVAVLSMLVFIPRLMEFFIVYTVSDVTLKTMNSVYTDPMLRILIAGPILYGMILLVRKNTVVKKVQE